MLNFLTLLMKEKNYFFWLSLNANEKKKKHFLNFFIIIKKRINKSRFGIVFSLN